MKTEVAQTLPPKWGRKISHEKPPRGKVARVWYERATKAESERDSFKYLYEDTESRRLKAVADAERIDKLYQKVDAEIATIRVLLRMPALGDTAKEVARVMNRGDEVCRHIESLRDQLATAKADIAAALAVAGRHGS